MIATQKKTLRFLASRIHPHRRWIYLSAFFALGPALVQVLCADLVRKLLDEAAIPKNFHKALLLWGYLVLLFAVEGVTDFLHRLCLRISVERTVRSLRNEVFSRFLVFSEAQMSGYTSGRALSHIVSDVFAVGLGMHVIADLIQEPLKLIFILSYLFYLSWKLCLLCLIALPLIAVLGAWLGKSARRNQSKIQASLEKISNQIVESMGGLRTAHAFGRTRQLLSEFVASTEEAYGYLIRLARTEELVGPATKVLTALVGGGMIAFAIYLGSKGSLTPGAIAAFLTAAGLLQQPLKQLNQVNVRIQSVVAAGDRILEVVNEPLDSIGQDQSAELDEKSRQKIVHGLKVPADLSFRNVSFAYPSRQGQQNGGKTVWALDGINLELKQGRRLALVGRSGSGKTTMSMLTLRFIDPNLGEVELAGQKASKWNLDHYRRHFAYVSQDVFLFNRSVRENLAFTDSEVSDADIRRALERANALEFVDRLPQGMKTNLGEHASTLSGGEKQRIAIARAFLRDSPILVLDEATSNLDAHSERAVQTALKDLMKNRSVLVIAHRLSTVREVDEVAVFDAGHLVELGAPQDLLQKPQGHFSGLWKAQLHSQSEAEV